MDTRLLRLLIVEDNPGETRLLHEMLLEAPGFNCSCEHVDRLSAAVDRLAEGGVDLVVLDLRLPDSDGLASLSVLIEADREVAIVVLTGLEDEEIGNEAIRQGAQDYLVKAEVDARLIVRSIRYALERKARENEMVRAESELLLLSRLTRGFSSAPDLESSLESLVGEVCRATGWVYGETWIPTADDVLVRGPTCCAPDFAVEQCNEENATLKVRRGEGIAGEVWESALPKWIPDVREASGFVDCNRARDIPLRTALFIPVVAGAQVLAVLAIFHNRERREDRRLMHLVQAVASDVGGMLKRRQTDDALALSERRLRQLMDTAQDGILLTDPDGAITYANQQALRLLDRAHDDLLGESAGEVLQLDFDETWQRHLRDGLPGTGRTVESHVARPDRASLWVLASFSPATDEVDESTGSFVTLTDITRLKKAEEADRILVEAGQIFASSLDPVETVDRLASLLVPAVGDSCGIRLFGESGPEHLVVRSSEEAMDAKMARMLETIEHLLDAGDSSVAAIRESGRSLLATDVERHPLFRCTGDVDEHAQSGSPRPSSVLVVPLTASNDVSGVLVVMTGTPERRLSEAELSLGTKLGYLTSLALSNARLYAKARAAIQSRDDILGVVAHDLRNPLGAISMYSSLLHHPTIGNDNREKWITGIGRSVRYMDRLIQDLLDITRLEAGGIQLEIIGVAVAPLIEELVNMFESLATRGHIRIETRIAPDLPEIQADPRRLLQVMSNLVGNAIKFTPAGGTVTIEATSEDGGVGFAIRDTGAGIAMEHLPHIFDRFWQAPNDRRGGAGLGLSIVKGLIEAHGGTISAESELGHGSVFRFTLSGTPASAVLAPKEAVSDGMRNRALRRGIARVVIADDHRVFLRSLEEVLTASGWIDVVAAVTSGEEAVERTRSLRPDLVLMDLEMKGIGGIAAIREISSFGRAVPVIALTAEPEESALFLAIDAGISGFLNKTADPEHLLETIDAVLEGGVGLSAEAQRSILSEFLEKRTSSPFKDLTMQERTIVTLIASGFNSAEIGRRVFLSPSTVDTYRSRLMRRLGLKHRSDVVQFALKAGLLRADDPKPIPAPTAL